MKNLMKSVAWFVALVGVAGCARVERIQATGPSLVLTQAAQTEAIGAKAFDQHGQAMTGARFTYSTSDAAVATVDAKGIVTAVKSGSASIEVASGDKKLTVGVEVKIPAKLVVQPVSLVGVGATAHLTAKVLDQANRPIEGATVAFAIADRAIAAVNGTMVTTTGIGQTNLTATFGALKANAPLAVTLPAFQTVVLDPTEVKLKVGTVAFLKTEIKDAAGADVGGVTVQFASSAEKVATVDPGGKLMGIAPGEATVTATAGDKSATVNVTVTR